MGHYKSEEHIRNSYSKKKYRRTNKVIKEEVCDLLAEAPTVDCSNIDVSVNGGTVTLRGSVKSASNKQQLEDLIEYISGVDEIKNELKVQKVRIKKNRIGFEK